MENLNNKNKLINSFKNMIKFFFEVKIDFYTDLIDHCKKGKKI